LFTTPAGQPITSSMIVSSIPVPGSAPRIVVSFGTGQRTQLTNLTPTTYASGTQALYGIWDWNLSSWNSQSNTQYQSLASGPATLGVANLTSQTFTYVAATMTYDDSNTVICWKGLTLCGSGNTQYGWYVNLQGASEQIIYNPTVFNGAFIVDSVVPANNVPSECSTNLDTGYTYAVSVLNGGAVSPIVKGLLTSAFPQYSDVMTAGVQTNATGTPYIVNTAEGQMNLVYQTISGQPCNGGNCTQFTPGSNTKANRMTWLELR
jgi:type IV pilus assembly protein PilY1